jgi:dUTP pyrophosphatase
MSNLIKVQCENGVEAPARASTGAAGYDLKAYVQETVTIRPGHRACIPTGIRMSIPFGKYGRVAPRSGLAVRNGIDVMAGVIDSDYRGTIGVVLVNLGDQNFAVQNGDRIAQIIIETCDDVSFVQSVDLDSTCRGAAGYGSTGK